MKRAIIFYNGDLTDLSRAKHYVKKSDYIICADGGTEHALKLGLLPNVIIGDLDSLPKITHKLLATKKIEWITYQKEKDETDSELALQHAIEKGFTSLIIFGMFGARLDHMLTNLFALSYLDHKGISATFIEGKQKINVIHDNIQLQGKPGDLISLIPLKGDVKEVTTTNLQYPLNHENLFFGYSRGISNVMTQKNATVTINDGLLLVIHAQR